MSTRQTGTTFSSIFTLANSAVGSGILSYPIAFASSGWVVCSLFCVLYALFLGVSQFTIASATDTLNRYTSVHPSLEETLLADHELEDGGEETDASQEGGDRPAAKTASKTTSYQDLCLPLIGPTGKTIVELTILVYLFGACCSYLIALGDMVTPLMDGKVSRELIIIVIGSCCVWPLSLLPTMSALKYSSILAVLSILYIVVLLTVQAMHNWEDNISALHATNFSWSFKDGTLTALPIICFSFQCHIQTPPVYSELQGATTARFKKIIATVYAICLTLYLPAGIFGIVACGERTHEMSDIMNCFADDKSLPFQIARVGITITLISAYPLNAFPARFAIYNFVQKLPCCRPSAEEDTQDDDHLLTGTHAQQAPTQMYIMLQSTVWYLLTLGIAMVCTSLTDVISLLGSTVLVVILFFVPAAMLVSNERTRWNVFFASGLVVLGLLTMVAGVGHTVNAISGDGGSSPTNASAITL